MSEPGISDKAQQRQDMTSPAGAKPDPLANATLPKRDGAVHGGEETKPGQMAGDEDISPNAPQSEIERVAAK